MRVSGAETAELAPAARQVGERTAYADLPLALQRGRLAACRLGIERMGAYEEAAPEMRALEIMAKSGALDPINRPGQTRTVARPAAAEPDAYWLARARALFSSCSLSCAVLTWPCVGIP